VRSQKLNQPQRRCLCLGDKSLGAHAPGRVGNSSFSRTEVYRQTASA
jgi:hypothetical protein